MQVLQGNNANINDLAAERFEAMTSNDDHSDFLGMCFGSKRCKRRRDERRKAREQRRRANISKKLAKNQAMREGTYKSTGDSILEGVGGLVKGIFGGDKGDGNGGSPEELAVQNYAPAPAPKKSKTMTYILIGIGVVVLVAVGFFAMKKK